MNLVQESDDLLTIEKSFHCCNGKVLRSLQELSQYASEMPLEVYNYHVKENENHFADWIRYVFNDKKLADSLKRVKKFETFVKKVNDLK